MAIKNKRSAAEGSPKRHVRLCYDCAKDGHLYTEDLERWLRSQNYSTSEACDRCGKVDFTCVFRPKNRPKKGLGARRSTKASPVSRAGHPAPFANTETKRALTSPGLEQSAESPQGRGRSGNKPLMQNRSAKREAIPTGSNPGENFNMPNK